MSPRSRTVCRGGKEACRTLSPKGGIPRAARTPPESTLPDLVNLRSAACACQEHSRRRDNECCNAREAATGPVLARLSRVPRSDSCDGPQAAALRILKAGA